VYLSKKKCSEKQNYMRDGSGILFFSFFRKRKDIMSRKLSGSQTVVVIPRINLNALEEFKLGKNISLKRKQRCF
jgi:hypothetical protein